ncbi:uncharacterized protein LOC100839393 [Brachypodium distachyon]|uniref:Uncharacterized protein n=1 Tax=Brachypodium distachyon TaxID=15368 RepID=A0A0Q3QWW1_BRADI|nr:uncharacterized protein LOC100839393 [Brachypodium distachyon]KQK05666.1 hypothetical protein BRADI_2g21737v3 [Brachypodium distachyon]KQK05667.1 hypothetical protein BRADI_2g21737v3 [Brachypodium distachyon]|eukprot:XP_003568213.1 uncharacterized protein LOC100839393 [Brachypodium distachyon]
MGIEAKHDSLCIKKVLRRSIRISYRCASEHWALFTLILLLYLLYRSSPGFFAFVMSVSPVIICATLLLGILLSYGSMHLPDAHEDQKTVAEFSAPKFGSFSRNIHFGPRQRFSEPAFKENTVSFKCWEIRNPRCKAKDDKLVKLDDIVPLLKGSVDQGDERIDARDRPAEVSASIPSMVTLHREVGVEEFMNANHEWESKDPISTSDESTEYVSLFEDVDQNRVNGKGTTFGLSSSSENDKENGKTVVKENQDEVLTDSQNDKVDSQNDKGTEATEDKPAEKPAGTCRWGRAFSVRQRKKLADIKMEPINADMGNQLDSSLGSPFARVNRHDDLSDFDSVKAGSYSSVISMAGVASVLDEIDPILGDEFAGPVSITNHDLGCDSKLCPQDPQISSDNIDEVDTGMAKNDSKDGEEKKDDGGSKPVFVWTVDDNKNSMDLGYSEVERSRRLEFLMAKRRSRKNIIFDLDKGLIDHDRNDVRRSADGFSRFPIQVQPISVPRRNPFDLDEADIPGSAPSILHGRKNLFELPFEESNDSGVPGYPDLDPQEFITGPCRDMVFRRHESFNFGGQARQLSRFKPCFVLEDMDIEEESTSNFLRQFSDKSMSKLSVITESDILSSVADQEERDELVKKEFLWDFQRQFSDKSMSKLSVLSESGTLSLVVDPEEGSGLINKDFLWYFQRQFSDKSVSRRSIAAESDNISSVADQDLLRQESDLGYAGSECSDVINFADDETLNDVRSGMESEAVENTAS